MQAAPLPFAGIRVLDVASFIAAPVAATVFADYGADVIKVEPPGQGDPNRQTWELASYPKAGLNYPWELDSRGKRSIALDLRREAAREVLYRLVSQADVLITNYPQP
ncbi:MAG: CoA transferase, partial [Betaproteobacteria bacterium]|nr:CoA transferase [Betaproteobacteria bacterium]